MLDRPLLLDLPPELHSLGLQSHVLDEIFAIHLEWVLLLDSAQFCFRLLHPLTTLGGLGSRNSDVDCLHGAVLVILRVDDILPSDIQTSHWVSCLFFDFSEFVQLVL